MSLSKLTMVARVHDQCPGCGGEDLEQYRTEKFSATYIVRYYKCRGCGEKFKTEQINGQR